MEEADAVWRTRLGMTDAMARRRRSVPGWGGAGMIKPSRGDDFAVVHRDMGPAGVGRGRLARWPGSSLGVGVPEVLVLEECSLVFSRVCMGRSARGKDGARQEDDRSRARGLGMEHIRLPSEAHEWERGGC